MPLKRCILKDIGNLAQFYDALVRQLNLPSHFGRNLDALWDVLNADLEGPIEIVWERSSNARTALGEDYGKIVALLKEVEKERADFRFIAN